MRYLVLVLLVGVAGCDRIRSATEGLFDRPAPESPEAGAVELADGGEDPEAETPEDAAEPVADARPDDIDPGWTGARQTIASLGDPSRPGLWLETPLVSQERPGRVVVRKTGATAVVTLLPAPGEDGAGSRLSLEAMRALLAPIDDLIELDVYSTS